MKMTKIKGWKRSQTSSGYYHKEIGKIPSFVWFEMGEDNKSRNVMYKKGLGDRPSVKLGQFKTRPQAVKFAIRWMKKHPKG